MKYLLLLSLLAAPALAETPMSGDEFEAMVEGKTLTFSAETAPFGTEYYAPNRRVIWSFVGGECVAGEWYEEAHDTGPSICFVYENDEIPKCWLVYDVDGKIRADYVNTPGTTVLYQAIESEPLVCGGVGA
ncbi:hypothetical protein L0666_05880 [Octadecabacter sp. CECT 8868]|uniref:hypothetical protein n=1 Tax=Octadecabacter algicola TaxID=2909342 RepID=UPI001F3D7163|nr:hypothetical protein [Octadecabacter algicola]MCF2904509.1 hypothetical protein [Octadecabacter algicola]